VVTPATQKDTVAGRVVERRWRDSKVLRALFAQVLDETPFIWQDHHLPSLGTIGAPEWGARMTMLLICGMDPSLTTKEPSVRGGDYRDQMEKKATTPITEYLTRLIQNVGDVQHMRYYPIYPKSLNGTWPNWEVALCDKYSFEDLDYSALAPGEQSWYGMEMENKWMIDRIMSTMSKSVIGGHLHSFEMPLYGNRASFGGIALNDRSLPEIRLPFPTTLKRISISHTWGSSDVPFASWKT
jgi:hypothetical protein